MATIKSYTDLEQSKRLAEILTLESADMNWHELPSIGYFVRAFPYKHDNGATEGIFPCWSLAALLGVLPNGKDVSTTLSRGGWNIELVEYVDKWWCEYEDEAHTKEFSVSADNPVDACYEMILKLHELKML